MRRMKDDPNWIGSEANIANSGGGDGAGTPAKVRGGAKKAAPSRKRASDKSKITLASKIKECEDDPEAGGDLMNEDDDEGVQSPGTIPVTPRKGNNNKVCILFSSKRRDLWRRY